MMVPLKTKLDIWDPIFKGTNVFDLLCLPRTLAPGYLDNDLPRTGSLPNLLGCEEVQVKIRGPKDLKPLVYYDCQFMSCRKCPFMLILIVILCV